MKIDFYSDILNSMDVIYNLINKINPEYQYYDYVYHKLHFVCTVKNNIEEQLQKDLNYEKPEWFY